MQKLVCQEQEEGMDDQVQVGEVYWLLSVLLRSVCLLSKAGGLRNVLADHPPLLPLDDTFGISIFGSKKVLSAVEHIVRLRCN